MNALSFEAKNKKFKSILFDISDVILRIPRYQRPYAWESEQISEFWNDLNELEQSYFIGSFIFNKENEHKGFIEIIDGQQRILTITIFIAVIRNKLNELGENRLANKYQGDCIGYEDDDFNYVYRIEPGESTKPFFEKYIQNQGNDILLVTPEGKEETRIKQNYEDLMQRLNELLLTKDSKEKKINTIKSLRKKLGDLIVIDIEIQNEEVAYEIFETVNARGIELSVSDLLKNLIFSKIKEKDGKDLAKEMWTEIEQNIAQTGIDLKKFIRYFWLSKHQFLSEKKLYLSIKREISDWEGFISELYDASVWYNALLEGNENDFESFKSYEKIFRSIFAIRLMNVSQCFVLFLCILQNRNRLGFDLYKVFQLIEKFTFQYSAICKLPGNRIEKIYSKHARKIYTELQSGVGEKNQKKNIQSIFNQLKSDLSAELPSKELFVEKFKELSYGRTEKARQLIKYTLEEANSDNTTGEHRLDFNQVNIEHILPQEPKKWGLSKKDVKEYVNKIGNLTLLSKRLNSSMGNEVLNKKLAELEKSEISITQELVKYLKVNKTWDENEILTRQNELAEISFDSIWKIN
ncbi:MAG: hypothetical protein COC01_10315 [Bacteroidetes bacterium]|nr:DUF262 domain-containing protein [Bacteroidia bacterium]MBN4052139.1 DUF262 domain-containing protein [Sphingobacteriaceae bacterium AH-315-L07]PCH65134.1 MAG: hypothetical protein COC01_10315 [Bacteroidota bacterium]